MLQIHISASLAKDLKDFVNPAVDIEPTALQWYGQKVVIDSSDCIILMELQSRYAMVFCGVTQYHLDNFVDVLQERLWREVCNLAQLDEELPEEYMALLSDMVLSLSQQQLFQSGYNRSVNSHISQVVDDLRDMVEYQGYELPVDMGQAMEFGLITNETLRKRKDDKEYFVPIRVFRDFWLNLLDVLLVDGEQGKMENEEGRDSLGDKVIHVDFIKKVKK